MTKRKRRKPLTVRGNNRPCPASGAAGARDPAAMGRRLSACGQSSDFVFSRERKQFKYVFCRGVYVTENTSRPTSVRVARLKRARSARSGVQKLADKVQGTLSANGKASAHRGRRLFGSPSIRHTPFLRRGCGRAARSARRILCPSQTRRAASDTSPARHRDGSV